MRVRSLVAVAAMMALSACAAANPKTLVTPSASPDLSPSPSSSPGALSWGTCPASVMAPGLQCAALKVPLDYARPNGATITLELSRKVHTSKKYLGVMLVNPGGPGGSGLDMPIYSTRVPDGVGARFDWIGWDPRGVGASKPALSCVPGYFGTDRPAYDAASQRATWLRRARNYAAACGRDQVALLGHMTTADNARDMDMIRRALGQSKINYYGFSWGSYLGQVYMTLFPSRVSRVVLDGVVNPKRAWYEANLDQNVAFERGIRIFFTWVAQHHDVYRLGETMDAVYTAFKRELATLAVTPAAGGKLGPDELTDAVLSAGYTSFGWAGTASALARLINGDNGEALLEDYQSNNAGAVQENQYAVYNAVQCTDVAWPTWTKTLADAERTSKVAPFETWANTWYNAPCLSWPAPAHQRLEVTASPALPRILLVSETYDSATPFSGALAVRALFPSASLIEGVNGSSHAVSLNGVPCTDDAIATYLATGRPPQRKAGSVSDLRCPPLPQPSAAMQ